MASSASMMMGAGSTLRGLLRKQLGTPASVLGQVKRNLNLSQGLRMNENTPSMDSSCFKIVSPSVLEIPIQDQQGLLKSLYVGVHAPVSSQRPGNGGLRLWSYDTEEDAVAECAELSRGMSLKHSIYNTGFGGAKLVANAKSLTDVPSICKQKLMEDVAKALHSLQGSVYTGCDMNTNFDDMRYLNELCPYVLASLDSTIDANRSTAHGVVGSAVEAARILLGGHKGKRFLVVGTGKVGTHVSELLSSLGCQVSCHDVDPSRADIPGCENVSHQDWWLAPHGVLVPCCSSGIITHAAAAHLRESGETKCVVGATNIPFASDEALQELVGKGDVVFVPDMLSSAGAVLADSIEHFSKEEYESARDNEVYAFVQTLTRDKTTEYLDRTQSSQGSSARPMAVLATVHEDKSGLPVGKKFTTFVNGEESQYDVVVVGGGMAGTAASYYLSKLAPDLKVAVLEAGEIADPSGSSYGESRMYRRMYSDEYFSVMQSKALDLWRDVERESGLSLLKENGLLFYGETDTGETVEGSIPGAAEIMSKLNIPHEYFDHHEKMDARWPMRSVPGYEGVYEASAGSINSSLACRAMMDLAQDAAGHDLFTNTSVLDLRIPSPGDVRITCADGKLFRSNKVVLATGAWTNSILGHLDAELDLELWAMHWGHYRVDPELKHKYPQWFCFRKEVPDLWDGGLYYGFPCEGDESVIKVGIDFCPDHPEFRMRDMADYVRRPNDKIVKLIDDFVRENWVGVGERVDMYSSPYTCTRDQYFVLDRLPSHEEVTLFTGGCGRAFKFAPLLGKLLAEKTLGMAPSHDIAPFSAARECVQWPKAKAMA